MNTTTLPTKRASNSQTVSCSKAAKVLRVSTSTIKRLCNEGVLLSSRTTGGHRRIHSASIERLKLELAEEPQQETSRLLDKEPLEILDWIERDSADYSRCVRQSIASQDLALCDFFDLHLAPVMHCMGELFCAGQKTVVDEHALTANVMSLLGALRLDIKVRQSEMGSQRFAMGGAIGLETHAVSSMMVEMVFLENGWNAQNLGTLVPEPELRAAVTVLRPSIVWANYTFVPSIERVVSENYELYNSLSGDAALFVGGPGVAGSLMSDLHYDFYANSMRELNGRLQEISNVA